MGFFTRLFGSGASTAPRLISAAEAERIINDYGAALMARTGLYSDASALPHPKLKIKEALMIGIAATRDVKERDTLKAAFMALADWQEGIGPGPHDLDVAARPGEDIRAIAKRVAEAGPAYLALSKRVTEEMEQLLAELKTLGL
jgi:hypothetical protein